MINKISFKSACNSMLLFLSVILVFHFLILTEIVPYHIVWGGRLENLSEMRFFVVVSITINLLIMTIIAAKAGYIGNIISAKIVSVALWVIIALFALSTVGNVVSKTSLETIIFTPFTLISAVLCYRMVIEK